MALLVRATHMRSSFLTEVQMPGDHRVLTAWNAPGGCGIVEGKAAPLPETFCSLVVRDARPVAIEDTAGHPLAALSPAIRSYFGVPIVRASGRVFGTLCLVDSLPRQLRPEHIDLMVIVARLLVTYLEGAERARLEGVLLAVRTLKHELNNQLTTVTGNLQLLGRTASLPPDARRQVEAALNRASEIAATVRRLESLTSIEEQQWSIFSTIDLLASPGRDEDSEE